MKNPANMFNEKYMGFLERDAILAVKKNSVTVIAHGWGKNGHVQCPQLASYL